MTLSIIFAYFVNFWSFLSLVNFARILWIFWISCYIMNIANIANLNTQTFSTKQQISGELLCYFCRPRISCDFFGLAVVNPPIMHKQNEFLMLHLITFQHDIIEYFMFPYTPARSRDILTYSPSLEVCQASGIFKCHQPRLSGFSSWKCYFSILGYCRKFSHFHSLGVVATFNGFTYLTNLRNFKEVHAISRNF